METREGGDASKMKENNIKIKERPRSLFYTTFRREERRRKSKPRREKEQQSKKRKEKKLRGEAKKKKKPPERAFSLFYSPETPRLGSHCLNVLAIACLGQPIKPFKHFHFGGSCSPSSCIIHFLALAAHYAFYSGGSCYSSFCIALENEIMQHNIFLMH